MNDDGRPSREPAAENLAANAGLIRIRQLKNRLHVVANRSRVMTPERLATFHSLVDAGEEEVALEILCGNVGENDYDDAGVTQEVADELRSLGEEFRLDPHIWSDLKVIG